MPLSATTRNISTAGTANTPQQPNSNVNSPSDVAECGSSSQKAGKTEEKREVKILMLHGYTQSGALFRSKTCALKKLMTKSLARFNLVPRLHYPTAPVRLCTADIPGYGPPPPPPPPLASEGVGAAGVDHQEEPEAYAWFRRDSAAANSYRHVDEGMLAVAKAIEEIGEGDGVDGIIGFSQGGAVAGMVAAALEETRTGPTSATGTKKSDGDDDDDEDPTTAEAPAPAHLPAWVSRLRIANNNKPLKFAVIYSGFRAAPPELQFLFNPPIETPTMHVLGGLDSVVSEERSWALAEKCVKPVTITHPGGHYVPVGREWVLRLVEFVRKSMMEGEEEKKERENEKQDEKEGQFAVLG